jgi:hypothetical protein
LESLDSSAGALEVMEEPDSLTEEESALSLFDDVKTGINTAVNAIISAAANAAHFTHACVLKTATIFCHNFFIIILLLVNISDLLYNF